MKIRLFVLSLFITAISFSQTKGTITGTVTDKNANKETLPLTNVVIKGTNKSTTTDINGTYSLSIEPGNYTIQFSLIGYDIAESKVTVQKGETVTVNKALGSDGYQLDDVIIRKTVNREKETALLIEQKNAVEIKQAIGSQELSRKGVGDAEGAVAKTTGVTKQEGAKNVTVRGLGDRYNSTSLNGLPLPSEDPEYKNIALKFFSTNIIKNIEVNKTFNGAIYGDVAGANININSKELNSKSELEISVGTGYNTSTPSGKFKVIDGYNYFGNVQSFVDVPITNLDSYDFKTSFKPSEISSPINTNFAISAGKKFNFENNHSLSVFAVGFSTNEYNYIDNGIIKQANASGSIYKNLTYEKYSFNTTQAGLINAKYKLGSGKTVSYNGLYIHDNSQKIQDYNGLSNNVNEENDQSFIRRQQINNNVLISNQLLAEYKVNAKLDSELGVSYNMIKTSEPDRKTNSYLYDEDTETYKAASNSATLNHRFFSDLKENDLASKVDFVYSVNPEDELIKKISFGANYRNTNRTFNYTQFNFDFPNSTTEIEIDNPDGIFNQNSIDTYVFDLQTGRGSGSNALNPFYYTGKRNIYAGYLQYAMPFTDKFIVQLGLRNEYITQEVEWDTNLTSSVTNLAIDPSIINKNYILPSIISKYSLNEKSAIRFAASKTYTYPQFKETAPFTYEDIDYISTGNPDLVPSTIYNFDLKYDFYLSPKEIISVGGFYKSIQDPINRIFIAAASSELSYVNLGNTVATGLELEFRKSIINSDKKNSKSNLDFGLNASYLYTNVKLEDNPNDNYAILPTNKEGQLEGASPLLINTDLSFNYNSEKYAITSSIVANYFYDKVFAIGTSGRQDLIEKAATTLDFVNKFEIIKNKLGFNLSLKNILNPEFKMTQEVPLIGELPLNSYKKGVNTSISIYWKL
jgi:hypothetical protein